MLTTLITGFSLSLFGGIGYYISNTLLLKNFNKSYGKDIAKLPVIQEFNTLITDLNGIKIAIPSSYGYNLIGYYFPAEKASQKTIITVHGYTGSKDHHGKYVKMFHHLGFNVIAYDHRNHGESGGDFISYGVFESMDLKAVVDYTKTHFPCEETLGIHGVSMGAATTLLYAGKIEDGADFYIADCPYSSFSEQSRYRLQEEFPYIPSFLHQPLILLGDTFIKWRGNYSIREAEPISYIHRIKPPVLFINTKGDTYIPPIMTEQLYERKRGQKDIYWTEEGEHAKAYEVNPAGYYDAVEHFLRHSIYLKKDEKEA